MTKSQILALMQGDTLLNKVRVAITHGAASIDQKAIQGADIFEIREMEFQLAINVAKLFSVDLTKDIPNDKSTEHSDKID